MTHTRSTQYSNTWNMSSILALQFGVQVRLYLATHVEINRCSIHEIYCWVMVCIWKWSCGNLLLVSSSHLCFHVRPNVAAEKDREKKQNVITRRKMKSEKLEKWETPLWREVLFSRVAQRSAVGEMWFAVVDTFQVILQLLVTSTDPILLFRVNY